MVDEEGRYSGETEFYAYGPFKAEAMRRIAEEEGIDLEESSAYSDSYTDLPMLEAVGRPVVVNPDRVLAKIAREREWEVMQFSKPVRLRDRVPVPSLQMTAAAGIGAAASIGALGALADDPAGARVVSRRVPARRFGWVRIVDGRGGVAQVERRRLAATKPRAMRMARISSFFMGSDRTGSTSSALPARPTWWRSAARSGRRCSAEGRIRR